MKKPKSIQEVYEEVKDYDLVLTSDVVLASALNRQIKTARVGKLAYTPKELAQKHSVGLFDTGILNKADLVLKVRNVSNLDLKVVHNAIERIIDIEKHTDDVETHLSAEEVDIYNIYKELATQNKSIASFDKSNLPANVAIIEPTFFNNVDKKVLPETFTEIKILTDEVKTFSNFYLFNSQEELIHSMLDLITEDNESDVAIILDTKSSVLNLIKSKLYEKNIDIHIKDYLNDNLLTRTVIDLLQTALYLDEVTVKEIKPFLEYFNIDIAYSYNNYLLKKYVDEITDDEKIKKLYDFLKNINSKSYKEYLKLFVELPKQLNDILVKLDLLDELINYENFSNFRYYINNFDVEIDNTKKGVLLADCKSSVVVDRPVCLYLNPDISWNRQISSSEYVNQELEEMNNLNKFQIILFQGDKQLFFVQTIKENEKNIPCFYFNQIETKEIKDFNDELFNGIKCSNRIIIEEESTSLVKSQDYTLDLFSQSSLNTFFSCPKKFEFSRISPSEEQTYFLKGTLLHAFAEFYVNHKEFCNEKEDVFFANILLKEYMQMIAKTNEEIERSIFEIGINNIKSFIDTLEINSEHNLVYIESQKGDENILSEILNKPISNKNTELSFANKETKLKGFIDLVINSTSVVDYKSSKKIKTIGKIITKSNLKLVKDEADFQPLVYLLELARHNPDKELSFYYYFFMNNYADVINQIAEFKDNVIEVKFYPHTFNEFISSDTGLEIICGQGARKDIVELLGGETIKRTLQENPLVNPFEMTRDISAYTILEDLIVAIKDTKKNRGIVEDFFKELYRLRVGSSKYPKALFFKEDLELFGEFVKEQQLIVNRYANEGFPKQPKSKETCKKCDFKDLCLGREK